jgi:coenzyme F420-reducing hydrogenase delta subunit/ferredoxin
LGLFALPFLPSRRTEKAPVAVVDPANCNGCRRCFADCPYAAITMVPHPNQRIGRTLAVVDADLCASCGICAGACPSSTPFRSVADLVTGIDMPQLPVGALRRRLREALEASPDAIVVFGCDHGADVSRLAADDTVHPFSLICAGQLPPSFVEYALRDGAAGVVVVACREGGCAFRFGERWTAERLAGTREPHLRASVERERVALVFAGAGDERALQQAIESLRQRIAPRAGPSQDVAHA